MDLTTLAAGAAIQCAVLTEWLSSQEAEICSEIICWMLLPALFSFTKGIKQRRPKILPLVTHDTPSPASSTGAWIAAASLGILCFYRVESKSIALIVMISMLPDMGFS